MELQYIGAIDIGGTKMAATVASREGLLARVTQATVKEGSPRAPAEQGIALLRAACGQASITLEELGAVGVSSCGPFEQVDGMLEVATPNICGGRSASNDLPNDWQAIPLEAVLREQFTVVEIENDCVAALVAERNFGAVQNEANCAYVTWSTGIGFGLCVDGQVLHGKNGNAGHAGHMLMSDTSTAICGCGNQGDLEALTSGRNLAKQLAKDPAELFAAAQSCDQNEIACDLEAREQVEKAAHWFGRGLYNVTTILDMRIFVIGGSVWNHHGKWLMPLVQQEIDSRFPALTGGVEIRHAALGSLVADIGALCLVMPVAWAPDWRARRPWEALERLSNAAD